MTATRAAIEAAAHVIAGAQLANVTGDSCRAAAVALADRGQLLTPVVLAEITAAARAEALAEVEHAITARMATIDRSALSSLLPALAWTLRGAHDGLGMARELVEALQVRQPDPCDPVEDEPAAEPDDCACGIPSWTRIRDDRYELVVGDVMWGLDHCDDVEIGPADDRPGWYLYGPEPYALGVWMGEVIAPAADTASRVIREHYAAEAAAERVPGPRLPLDDVETGGAL
ncbi:hypothetical protein B4N89_02505 [Embleya scabrispora]|uniref:Uncharacterized protein n=1 Tax=Embleya scabrispora TaxID=159449 RepID=A0A1T3NT33_9ACTN|nr:hypothetical protein [Embleya scabrispora]OPC79968.1 hypothetical protein B4N89_02505 [Embleya scabrispora]